MYSKFHLGIISSLFIFFRMSCVSSLMCHVCTTKNSDQEDCIHIPKDDVKYLQNCTAPKDQACRIQEQWLDFEYSGQSRDKHIIRQCASTAYDPENPCYYRTGYLGRMSVCLCAGDGCNEATNVASDIFKVLLVFVSAFLLI